MGFTSAPISVSLRDLHYHHDADVLTAVRNATAALPASSFRAALQGLSLSSDNGIAFANQSLSVGGETSGSAS